MQSIDTLEVKPGSPTILPVAVRDLLAGAHHSVLAHSTSENTSQLSIKSARLASWMDECLQPPAAKRWCQPLQALSFERGNRGLL